MSANELKPQILNLLLKIKVIILPTFELNFYKEFNSDKLLLDSCVKSNLHLNA
jgi:hypothetical protein